VKAAGARLGIAGVRDLRLLLLGNLCWNCRLVSDELDVRGGCSGCPVPGGRCSQMFELTLLLATTERAAS
jgi:hypothetical protein